MNDSDIFLFYPHHRGLLSFFKKKKKTGTREAAFVYALSAATISHTIARACTSGDLRLCSCGPIPAQILEPGYRWGGCADNLHYGLIMGSKFSDAPMKMKRAGSHANKLMHLHNAEVGRQVSKTECFYSLLFFKLHTAVAVVNVPGSHTE